ncbi:MAG TPA: PD-(D/E)XK nuclease family protein, partial [Solirubrobacteraceae bacterium]|nr:PD-(D/E)XK nuclease family protein [Solirubrobacteraceae bacterium]
MPITLITGPANAGKAQLVMEAVRRHLAHDREPTLVVPTRVDVEHYLRELAGQGTALGVRVERFEGLIAEVVRRAGIGKAALGELTRERVIATLLARAGHTAGTAGAAGLVRALAEVFAELQVRRVTPARLSQALGSWRAADAASSPHREGGFATGTGDGHAAAQLELGRLFADYCRTLEWLGRMDIEQRAVLALDALRERPALWGPTPVLLYGFDDLTALQLDAIETLGRVVDTEVTVSLAYEPGRVAFVGRAASFHALAPLAARHHQLQARADHYAPHARAALAHLERSLFEPQAQVSQAARVDAGTAVTLLEGGGERAELELIAGEIRGLLDQGVPAAEIAVLVRAGGTDLDLLEEVFAAAEITFALARRRRFADSAVGRALIGLLRCVPAAGHLQPADRAARAHAEDVAVGSAQGELADLLAWLRAPGQPGAPAADDSGACAADRLELLARRSGALSAEQARVLWEQRLWPLESIDRLAASSSEGEGETVVGDPVALCERAARELQWLFNAPRRGRAQLLARDELDEAAALSAGRRALSELRELARAAPELAPRSAPELARVLERLDLFSGVRPEHGPGDAVAVLDPLALRARRVRALFVCGLQEGVFPAHARPRPILAEEERRRLAEVSGLRLGEPQDVLAAERYLLYAAVSRPQERLFLSWHTADDDGEVSSRSLFVDDICDLFDASLQRRRGRRPLGAVDDIPERSAGAGAASAHKMLSDQRVLAGLRARAWSASSLERWIACPTSWFVERMLRPQQLEPDPEPLARGALAHAALKDTLEGLRRETGTAQLTPAGLPRARELLAAALAEHESAHPLSVSSERRTAVRRRLHADLERYLEHAAACAGELQPHALELGFGFTEDDQRGQGSELPAFDLGDGVLLRGRIDRVDVSAAGEAVVYDYKGSRAPAGARWIRD